MSDIVKISGKQGAGKTSTAAALIHMALGYDAGRVKPMYEYAGVMKFADPLYELHEVILNKMQTMSGVERVRKDGTLLQLLGTEWGREKFGENVWVDILRRKVAAGEYGGWQRGAKYLPAKGALRPRLIVIDDMRFENEFDAFPEALRVRLEAPAEIRMARADAWRQNADHPSETGLDVYAAQGKFDLVIQTGEGSSPAHVATLIAAQLQKRTWMEKRV